MFPTNWLITYVSSPRHYTSSPEHRHTVSVVHTSSSHLGAEGRVHVEQQTRNDSAAGRPDLKFHSVGGRHCRRKSARLEALAIHWELRQKSVMPMMLCQGQRPYPCGLLVDQGRATGIDQS